MWKSIFVVKFPRREIVGSKDMPTSDFNRFCLGSLYKSRTNFMFSSLLRVPISARKSDTRNYTLRVSKILQSAKECNSVNSVSDSWCEGQMESQSDHLAWIIHLHLNGSSGDQWGLMGSGRKMPSIGVFFTTRQKKRRYANWMILQDSMADAWKKFSHQLESKLSLPFPHQSQTIQLLIGPTQKVLVSIRHLLLGQLWLGHTITSFEVGSLD